MAPYTRPIEEIYQKKSQLEHILLRPDTYIGSVEKDKQVLWVYESEKLVQREITFVPGLYKIFDEILVNAADNKQRDPSMDTLKVEINVEKNFIQVWNNGKGLPVEIHAKELVYVPEMIFGHLLTSSNYNDSEKKTTGGRNGYGAKLANIFSTQFVIETADGERRKKYKQTFSANMSKINPPIIKECKESENWTSVTFKPDLAKFHMEVLESDTVALMSKRVLDIAGCLGKSVKVKLNGKRVPVKSFNEYVGLYVTSSNLGEGESPPPRYRIYEKVNNEWEICVSMSDGQFQQVSFVNSIATIRGGTHVQAVTDQIVAYLLEKVRKKVGKNGPSVIRPAQIKSHLWVFVNCLVVNPAFDSQTKEWLNTRPSNFGTQFKVSEEFLKKVGRSKIADSVMTWASTRENKEMKRTDGSKRQRLTGIPKLDDANEAGGRNSGECTLILTEGDSAKALAVSGLSVVGRDKYGVFPLRGKLLNVREAGSRQVSENAEIAALKQIMGLQQNKEYNDAKSLRYGHIMIMTDQDHDGSHIKGLVINFLHRFWPSLLKIPNFLQQFVTPIVKAKGPRNQTMAFYSMPEYESWKESLGNDAKKWSIKYYKGLGTSTPKEAKEYFSALPQHRKRFHWMGEEDGDHIDLAFSKKRIEGRKEWLRNFQPGTFLDISTPRITYSDFVDRELVLFSVADNLRSIPSLIDGLKPGQRKILFSCFKRRLKADIKVAQLAGYVSEHSAYHHGEVSLMATIVGMAQDFVGSQNNINLLLPSGQFGTRLQGGKDAASPRYIYTRLSPLTRKIFPEADDCLVNYLYEDGQKIEPTWYIPILPMVLVNGAEGIGTGWSTSVPSYNPRDVVENIKRMLRGEEMIAMAPWYRNFKGTVQLAPSRGPYQSFQVTGVVSQLDNERVQISELPVRKWTQDYKEFLEGILEGGKDGTKEGELSIKDMREYHTDTDVLFELSLAEDVLTQASEEGLEKKFKLSNFVSTSNMHLFDKDGRIQKFDSPQKIIEAFFPIRLEFYEKRKAAKIKSLSEELLRLENKVNFIMAVITGNLILANRKKIDILMDLRAQEFVPFPKDGKSSDSEIPLESEELEVPLEGSQEKGSTSDYDYLLSLPLWSLTWERVQNLSKEKDEKKTQLENLLETKSTSLWEQDLEDFLHALEAWEKELENEREAAEQGRRTPLKGKGIKRSLPSKGTPKTKVKGVKSSTMKSHVPPLGQELSTIKGVTNVDEGNPFTTFQQKNNFSTQETIFLAGNDVTPKPYGLTSGSSKQRTLTTWLEKERGKNMNNLNLESDEKNECNNFLKMDKRDVFEFVETDSDRGSGKHSEELKVETLQSEGYIDMQTKGNKESLHPTTHANEARERSTSSMSLNEGTINGAEILSSTIKVRNKKEKRKSRDEDSDDSFELGDANTSNEAIPPLQLRPRRNKHARKVYIDSSSEDDEHL